MIDPNTLRVVQKHSFAFLSLRLFDEYLIVGSTMACPVKLSFHVELLRPREESGTTMQEIIAWRTLWTCRQQMAAARRWKAHGMHLCLLPSTCVVSLQGWTNHPRRVAGVGSTSKLQAVFDLQKRVEVDVPFGIYGDLHQHGNF